MHEEQAAAGSSTGGESIISVIGLGYVGLPFALAFVRQGFKVIGIEVNQDKIRMLEEGRSYIQDVSDSEVMAAVSRGALIATADYAQLAAAEAVVLCIPTPLTQEQSPDLSYLDDTCRRLLPHLREGQLIVVESTTYPGTTREMVQPILERSGMRAGVDFHMAYSPERIDPGNRSIPAEDVPKIVSGLTGQCLDRICKLYSRVFRQVVPVSSTETAEAAKLLENSFRLINISFINEFAKLCDALRINVWEVIEAAGTKPYGFMAFQPGPGIGGHCIPVDPLYLQWKLRESGGPESRFIELARSTNDAMPSYIADRIERLLSPDRALSESSILILGVTYKRDVADIRESSALRLLETLQRAGANVAYHDPYVPAIRIRDRVWHSVELTDEQLAAADCVVIHTDHALLPIERIVANAAAVYDARNATRELKAAGRIERLGGG